MIAKVLRGYQPGGLLRYLFGPGRFEEHRNPRVVASWDGAPWLHQPDKLASVVLGGEVLEPGEFDLDLRQLVTTMTDPAQQAGLPTQNPPRMTAVWAAYLRSGQRLPRDAPAWLHHYRYDPRADAVVLRPGYVWHCPVRLHPTDPVLSDQQWQHIAQRLMTATGIQQAGCRWIAVRHAEDHIHLVATLVDERTGRRVHPYGDHRKLRAACLELEREFGLVATAPADRTAAPAPSRAEHGKAARLGRPRTAREELRRLVSQCAAASHNSGQFLAELTREGLDPRTVGDEAGRIRGYSVSWAGDRTINGLRIRYSGSALAPDLTWPKLEACWATTSPPRPLQRNEHGRVTPAERRAVLAQAAQLVDRATAAVRDNGHEEVDDIIHATGEVLAVLSRSSEGSTPGPLTNLASRYDRAARTPHQVLPADMGLIARELRHTARTLGAIGVLTGRGEEKLATVALLVALAGLVAEIAAWQQVNGRVHQAAAARSAARAFPVTVTADTGQRSVPRQRPSLVDLERPLAARRPDVLGGYLRPRARGPR